MNTEYQRPPIKVALMGLGRSMLEEHYPIFRKHPALFNVVAACDLQRDRRDMVAKDFPECRMFRQFSDMLDEQFIDLVVIATTTKDHVKHATESLGRGYWTLVESPMATTVDDAQRVRGAAQKAKNRIIVMQRGLFEPDFMLAKQTMSDVRLGPVYDIKIRREDFVRRDDWQTVKRLGGGAAYYAMPDLVMQALRLLPVAPVQMWSELKRIASLGDAEDFAHVNLTTRGMVSADIEYNGGVFAENRSPSFEVRGERGTFRVRPGATTGEIVAIDPDFSFPRRRSSVRTPPLGDLHEQFPVKRFEVSLPKDTPYGPSAFWKRVYESVRTGVAFPISIEESIEAVKFVHLMKKTSPFGK